MFTATRPYKTARISGVFLKRSLKGTYVAAEPYHLKRYIDEQAFRYNNREMNDIQRFVYGMRHIVGRRLTYKNSPGKTAGVPWLKGENAERAGAGQDEHRLTSEQFESTPEFRAFKKAMKKILEVSKTELDE